MKILHLMGGVSHGGGAEKGLKNLHQGLLQLGIDSIVGFNRNGSDECFLGSEHNIVRRLRGGAIRILDRWRQKSAGVRRDSSFSLGWTGHRVSYWEKRVSPDIIHLHWPHQASLDFESLRYIECPIVWTMRDMWAFTGGCHYTLGCTQYHTDCRDCPYIGNPGYRALTGQHLRRKANLYVSRRIHFVAISPWEKALAERSEVMQGQRISMIPNCVQCQEFFSTGRRAARVRLKLPAHTKIYLIGAQDLRIAYKGPELTAQIMENLPPGGIIATFGRGANELVPGMRGATHFGYISDPATLRDLYSAADVFLCLSREEVFGKTVIEALACGTPAVVYREGGMASLLGSDDGVEVADSYNWQSFLEAARRAVHRASGPEYAIHIANGVRRCFDAGVVAEQYVKVYRAEMGLAVQ